MLFHAKDDYIEKLRQTDSRVLFNKHGSRPYYYLSVQLDDQCYAIPFSSPKETVRYNGFTQIFINGKDQSLGRLFLLNMIPFQQEAFTKINFEDSVMDDKYKNLLFDQIRSLKKQSEKINNKAEILFRARYNPNHYKYEMLQKHCCDFKKLELVCKKYDMFE